MTRTRSINEINKMIAYTPRSGDYAIAVSKDFNLPTKYKRIPIIKVDYFPKRYAVFMDRKALISMVNSFYCCSKLMC